MKNKKLDSFVTPQFLSFILTKPPGYFLLNNLQPGVWLLVPGCGLVTRGSSGTVGVLGSAAVTETGATISRSLTVTSDTLNHYNHCCYINYNGTYMVAFLLEESVKSNEITI